MPNKATPDDLEFLNPWEYPPEISSPRSDYTMTELFTAVEKFKQQFHYQIGVGFEITPLAVPVIEYAIDNDDPQFLYNWIKQILDRCHMKGIVL